MVIQYIQNPGAQIAQIHGQRKLMVRFPWPLSACETHICKNEGSGVGLTCSLVFSCCVTTVCAEIAPAGIYSVSLAV